MAEAAIVQRLIGPRLGTTAVFLVDGVGIGAWAAGVPAIRRALDLSDSALSLSLLAFAAGGIVAMPAASLLLTRMTSRRATILLAIAIALGMFLPGLARSLPVLVVAAFIFGMSKGALDVSMNTHAVAIQRAWGGPIMSSFHAAFSTGGLLGSIVMGFLFAQGLGVTAALGLMMLAVLPVVATAAVLMRGMAPDPDVAVPAAAFAWPSRALLGIGLLCFLSMLIEGGMADWSGVYLSTVAGAATATAAAGYAAFSMMMVAGRLGGDWTVRRLGEAPVLRLGAGLAALGFAIALGLGMPVPAMAGFALVGLGVSNIVPLLFSASARSGSVARSTAIAMTATVGYAGFLLGPPIIGFTADHVGLQLALGVLLLAAAFIACFAVRATRTAAA